MQKPDETTDFFCAGRNVMLHISCEATRPPTRPPPTRNVASVTLQIRASDLAARHQRLVADQVRAKKF